MDTARLLRTSGTLLAVAGLLLSGCSSGGSPNGSSAPADSAPVAASSPDRSPAALAPLPTAVPAALKPYYRQRLAWHDCAGLSGLQCATLRAPLDYAHPSAGDVKLAVARKTATGPGPRIGSLLVNPGGPGGSAIDYLQYAAGQYPAPVSARYDMVGLDPRGVARSEPIKCLDDSDMDAFTQVDTTPDNQAGINALAAADRKFAAGCKQHSGRLLPHVSTIESARDMDLLRAALGDNRLNYVGKSYGTFLGATYAGLFPSRVGHLVLDGAMDPSLSSLDMSRTQAGGFETAFEAFAEDCVQHTDCPMGENTAAANAYIDHFLASLDAHPLPTGEKRQLGEALGTTALLEAMYSKDQWVPLREALRKANDGDGSGLLAFSDRYYMRDGKGVYSNLMAANAAVNCLDLPPAAKGPADITSALPAFRQASQHFGTDFAWMSLSCAYWPVHATGRPERIPARGAAPIVVIGTTRDPATPYAWARSLAHQLTSGRLLTYDGDGHTAYAAGSDCIDTAVNAYLLQNRPPVDGTRCG